MDAGKIVSDFMLKSCRTDRRSNLRAVNALCYRVDLRSPAPDINRHSIAFTLTTGSVAEIYIEPVIPCVADTDTMYYYASRIALPEGAITAPVISLPTEFKGEILWLELRGDNNRYHGYVYLQDVGKLIQQSNGQFLVERRHQDSGSEIYVPNLRQEILMYYSACGGQNVTHGPADTNAQKVRHLDYFDGKLSGDSVMCIPCPEWPTQAASWPTRDRDHGWPDSATIGNIVQGGCHLVPVSHRQCRQDAWKSKYQWRLSFSRAEIVLLNSWTPVQQIVYHMLRIFMKKSDLSSMCRDCHEQKIVSNYNIKTLMLWAVELKPWKENSNLVTVCRNLLRTLATWMGNVECKQYFVSNCNVFEWSEYGVDQEKFATCLASVTNDSLANWFIHNYIRICITHANCRLRDEAVLDALFVDVSTIAKLIMAVNTVSLHCAYEIKHRDFQLLDNAPSWFALWFGPLPLRQSYLHSETYDFLKSELPKLDSRLCECLDGVFALHVASHIERRQISLDEIIDAVLRKIVGINQAMPHKSPFDIAVDLLKWARGTSDTLALIQTEIALAHLHRALKCDLNTIQCLASIYLAAQYYSGGKYQKALYHCTQLTKLVADHSLCGKVVVECQQLPQTDEEIDNASGLTVLFRYVQTAALFPQEKLEENSLRVDIVFSAELFAFYLRIKCLFVTTAYSSRNDLCNLELWKAWKQYETQLMRKHAQPYTTDILLYVLLSKHIKIPSSFVVSPSQGCASGLQFDAAVLHRLLVSLAVERLTVFREIQRSEFDSNERDADITVITRDFQTMYDFKCKKYRSCLIPCAINPVRLMWAFANSSIPVVPTFFPLLDDDIIKLRGLTHLITGAGHLFYSLNCLTFYILWGTVCMVNMSGNRLSKKMINDLLHRIQNAHTNIPFNPPFDRAVLQFIYRRLRLRLSSI